MRILSKGFWTNSTFAQMHYYLEHNTASRASGSLATFLHFPNDPARVIHNADARLAACRIPMELEVQSQ